jgi:predicted ester cyclase
MERAMSASDTGLSRRAAILGSGTVALTTGLAAFTRRADAAGADEAYNRLLDRYLAAVNAHDTGAFPEIFTEAYLQHSGRSPSGLQAQIANFQRIFENWPDFQSRIEDRIFGGDRIVARTTFSATHAKAVLGFAPTGKRVSWGAIDIWRVENGKLAEHWDMVDVAGLQKQLRGE